MSLSWRNDSERGLLDFLRLEGDHETMTDYVSVGQEIDIVVVQESGVIVVTGEINEYQCRYGKIEIGQAGVREVRCGSKKEIVS